MLFAKNANAQMEFIQNNGQWNSKVNYKGDFNAGSFFLENNGYTVLLNKPDDLLALSNHYHPIHAPKANTSQADSACIVHSFAYNVTYLGANNNPQIVPDKALATYNNYFIGNDKGKWANHCKIYNAVTYKNIYPNIDIRYYSTNNKLKYDFIVHPGGNPAAIAMRYDGGVKLSIQNKLLIIGTTLGQVTELAPYSYQTNVARDARVTTQYQLNDNVVSFSVGKYNPEATLVIDPELIFSSFTRSVSDNWGYTATPGNNGTFFAGGVSFNTGYPTSLGAFQTTYQGNNPGSYSSGYDISIFKFSADGRQRVYATYLGGSDAEQPHSMIADAAGNLIIAGRSNSPNYPLLTNIPANGAAFDIVLTKLNASGSALLGSAKIGGTADDGVNIADKAIIGGDTSLRRNYGNDAKSEVILDKDDNVILASCTRSANFPTFAAGQPALSGAQDGVILKLTPNLSTFIFSTYFGGVDDDACFVATISPLTNNIYIAGATKSNNLPGNRAGTLGSNYNANIDGFITQLLPSGSAILNTTYIGTNAVDFVYGIQFDKFGFPYIMGTTTGTWPIINATYQVPNAKQFIAKLQPNLSAYVYSTNFGTSAAAPNISPIAFLVDRCENVYVSGWGGNVNAGYSNSGTAGLPQVNPITGLPAPDGSDFYFFVLKKDAQSQLFGSSFGQNGGAGDHVDGGTSRFDNNGIIYQAMCANCLALGAANFPTLPSNVWGSINPSNNCNLAAIKIDMDFAGIGAEIQSSIAGVLNDTLGCVPVLVSFKDTLQKGITYYWNFNSLAFPNATDTTTTAPAATHLFTTVGIFKVRLISEDLTTCNLRDTAYITINISDRVLTPRFSITKIGPCTVNQYQFTNTSFASLPSTFTPQSFVWDYGDGSPKDTANLTPARIHTYASAGTYLVTLTAVDNRFCNTPQIDTVRLTVRTNVRALTTPVALVCGQSAVVFQNISEGGNSWLWQVYNDANILVATSTNFSPSFTFDVEGNYRYRLIATDSTTCNITDTSAFFTFRVLKNPIARFDYSPRPPQPNTPYSFINLSSFANSYLWKFGDGEQSTLFEPVHEYEKKGNYTVTLYAFNNICKDSISQNITVLLTALLDVPNAFTPGKFGQNGIVYVRGFGIEKMDWRIYNRWGQLVFTSNNRRVGWDGMYKGVLQPTDVYTYTLAVEFVDGEKVKKTGDISLLR